jgi:hypothetical protein
MVDLGRKLSTLILILALALGVAGLPKAYAQVDPADEAIEEELEAEALEEEEEALEEEAPIDEAFIDVRRDEELEPGEAENRWKVKINAAIRANYVFNDSPDSFVIKYRWEIEGQANAATAVIRGEADISAEVEGFLAKWPTGECSLSVTIPKVPFELTFRKSDEDRGSVALKFRRNIMETWQSKCTFTDAPGARFETTGDPERWLAKAIDKARPPLRSIVTDLGDIETTTSFVINKEVIDDPPLGSVEIEGTGVVTITPGGGEE